MDYAFSQAPLRHDAHREDGRLSDHDLDATAWSLGVNQVQGRPYSLKEGTANYRIDLQPIYQLLRDRLLEYFQLTYPKQGFNQARWAQLYEPERIVEGIIDHIFEEKMGGEPHDLYQAVGPWFARQGVPAEVAQRLTLEILNFTVHWIASIFPELRFGYGVNIHYGVATGQQLVVTVNDDYGQGVIL